jgi:hypothetical protein
MGKSTISMAIFNSFLYVYQMVNPIISYWDGKTIPKWSVFIGFKHIDGQILEEHDVS